MKHDLAMMKTAMIWAKESYCKRRQVGAVVAKDNDPLAVGFNGTISGLPNNCEEHVKFSSMEEMQDHNKHFVVECPECEGDGYLPNHVVGQHCDHCDGIGYLRDTNVTSDYTLHAEFNAITRAVKHADLKGASIYITLAPCKACANLIAAHKIKHVFYKEDYRPEGIEILKKCKIKVTKLDC